MKWAAGIILTSGVVIYTALLGALFSHTTHAEKTYATKQEIRDHVIPRLDRLNNKMDIMYGKPWPQEVHQKNK